jgi:hypothetical protein
MLKAFSSMPDTVRWVNYCETCCDYVLRMSFREFQLSETGLPTTGLGMAAMLADVSPNKAEVNSEQERQPLALREGFWEVPSPTRQAQGVPEKELVAREVDGDELRHRFLGRHGRAFEYGEGAGPCAPEELRGQRQEELVGEAITDEGMVQDRTALDEEHVHSVTLL